MGDARTNRTPSVILIGLRGSGKSTIGKLVAGRLGLPFVDLDDRVAARLRAVSPAEAIRAHGIDTFREAEVESLREAVAEDCVLSLGGGTPTAPGAVELLRGVACPLVYLHAEPSVLRDRLSGSVLSSRPSLTGQGTLAEIDEIYLARDPLYRELGAVIECGGVTRGEVVDRVLEAIENAD